MSSVLCLNIGVAHLASSISASSDWPLDLDTLAYEGALQDFALMLNNNQEKHFEWGRLDKRPEVWLRFESEASAMYLETAQVAWLTEHVITKAVQLSRCRPR